MITIRRGRIGGNHRIAFASVVPRRIAVRARRPARRSFMSATKEVVIIGAGPGGLASAMLLASAGFRVKVLERRDRVGGRTSAIEWGGFRFDLGPTFFLYPAYSRRSIAPSAANSDGKWSSSGWIRSTTCYSAVAES
jgi:hypothetical protein